MNLDISSRPGELILSPRAVLFIRRSPAEPPSDDEIRFPVSRPYGSWNPESSRPGTLTIGSSDDSSERYRTAHTRLASVRYRAVLAASDRRASDWAWALATGH